MKKYVANFALDCDAQTEEQFKHCYTQDFVVKAALMPDAHSGYVAPIGAVLIAKDYVVPAWVGFDIGCGVTAVQLKGKNILQKIKSKRDDIYAEVRKSVPMGLGKVNHPQNVHRSTIEQFNKHLGELKKETIDPEVFTFIKNKGISNLGSLGEGNHFIEIGEFENEAWIIIHSGSRNLGHKVATTYMKKSANTDAKYEATHPIAVESAEGKEYLHVLNFLLEFALLNRLEMALHVVEAVSAIIGEEVEHEVWVNKNHNHAVLERGNYIHRKGATPAKKGERGVIPGNMRDGCYLVEGLGNPNFLYSSSHGAGRKMSRTQARKQITMPDFKKAMIGITGTVEEGTLDEAPDAYKDIHSIMEAQKDSVKIVKLIKPIINWKGSEKVRHD